VLSYDFIIVCSCTARIIVCSCMTYTIVCSCTARIFVCSCMTYTIVCSCTARVVVCSCLACILSPSCDTGDRAGIGITLLLRRPARDMLGFVSRNSDIRPVFSGRGRRDVCLQRSCVWLPCDGRAKENIASPCFPVPRTLGMVSQACMQQGITDTQSRELDSSKTLMNCSLLIRVLLGITNTQSRELDSSKTLMSREHSGSQTHRVEN
jgi:hypothetical protein